MPITYEQHAAGAARCAEIIGLIPADHPQLWTRDALITRAAETLRERTGMSWESACRRAERAYAGLRAGSHECIHCGALEAMPGHEC